MLRLTCLVFIFAALAAADVQTGVVRSGGQPIPGATVTAECGTDKITTVTDGDGRFEMGGLPSTPCKFSIAMFGFEQTPVEAKASANPITFDLKLQAHATMPVEPAAEPKPAATVANSAAPASAAPATPAPAAGAKPAAPAPTPSLAAAQAAQSGQQRTPGRGGRNGQGRGGQNAQNAQNGQTGFQNLNLQGNALNPTDGEVSPGGAGGLDASAAGASDALQINGTISSDVQGRPGDGLGMGGPGGFGGPGGPGGFGGPGGIGGAGLADNANPFGGGGLGGPGGGGPGGPGGPGGGGRGGGGFGGGGGRGGGGFGGRGGRGPQAANGRGQFGNRINRGRGQQWRLSAFYGLGNSALNARPYSFTAPQLNNGELVPKAAYANNRFGFSVGGPLEIPHLFRSEKTFWFVNYTGVRSKTGFDQIGTVPTTAERTGDFSAIAATNTIYNPATNSPFPGNLIPSSLINPTAAALLNYFPLPNVGGTRNNYQLIGANPSNNDNLQVQVQQTITAKDHLNANVSFQDRNSATTQTFGFKDPTTGSGLSSSLAYSRTINRNLINTLTLSLSRNLTRTMSYFSNGQNIEADLGINGVFDTPLTYGPPTLSFENFTSLSDSLPSTTRAQTTGITDALIQVHGKSTITYGGLLQRRQNNLTTTQGARGTFSFTGVETEQIGTNGLPVTNTGYDLADFLLDMPYQTSVDQYINSDTSYYFRETVGTAYVSDDYRWKSNFSIISGLRWEYYGPFTEKNDRMANLDITPNYTGVAIVTPGQTGPLTGIQYPAGLIKPDYKLFSPREGIAWKPFKKGRMSNLVIRAGYGIYYTGGVFSAFTTRLGVEQPFVYAINETNSPANPLTLQNGFMAPANQTIQNTFAVDPDYKPAYAQSWNYTMQDTFWRNYVFQLGYQGTKGTHLDTVESPNRAPLGTSSKETQTNLAIPYAGTFEVDSPVGNSNYNALQVSFLRRQARNRSFNITYVFSKAIDDTSTLGGGVVQILNDLAAERALSNYDVRHRVTANYQIQSPVGPDRTSWRWSILRGWQLNGNITVSSGTPFTATVAGDPSGTGIPGQARAEATGVPVSPSTPGDYFNVLAFAIPASGTFGDAARNTIPGIPTFNMNASVLRTFRFKERHQMSLSVTSSNPLNHVNVTGIGTVIGSSTQGLPENAGSMRTLTVQTRFTF